MTNVEHSQYAATWQLNNRTIVKYTPDALIFLNGDTTLPGCPRCRGRVEIQRFVTSVSVEAGTDPGSHSATLTLTLPRVQGEQVFIDGYNLLRPGLEVNIFFRGYFPIRGVFKHLADPQAGRELNFANPTTDDRLDLSKYASYPYYPAFHGVVTQVSYDYSDGFYNGSLQCASLLHFWQYQNFASAGAWFAQGKPNNDPARPTLFGHNFSNVTPFGIIYTLYRDVAGAAGGVEFALSESSNLDAAVPQGDRQLFDQVTLYWEQRFKTRIQSLRMYGVNGQLFNAAQQAWLGSASTRDVNELLPSVTFNDSTSTRTEHDPMSSRLSVAKSLGLGAAGLDFVYSPLIKQDNELVNMSILDMFAFTQAIGELGPGNLWQTTYETKLDIAQAVCEVTGYEFFQDVDGDLVFKPPFYNLDTSTNRYYRLEDQDIINISFTEKEPTATYIIVRGTWFAGLSDVAKNTDELGLRGMYVDWKLVAKFGWRPGPTLDITYQTDPKVLFWIGVARLDLLNVDTYSASVTIPIRPELRPGYPVYIPFCDCYYYVSQLSHQFAFGGQCTTSLVLTCRRAKFHAPGYLAAAPEGQSAIDLIRLDRPDLPPRPLEIFDNGIPRIVGFPNVVLALDPRKFDPNFSVVGAGIDYFLSTDAPADLLLEMLRRDIDSLKAFGIVPAGSTPDEDGRLRIEDPTTPTRFRIHYGKGPGDFREFGLEELTRAFADYKAAREDLEGKRQELRGVQGDEALARAEENAFNLVQRQQGGVVPANAARGSALSRADTLQAEILDEQAKLQQDLQESGDRQLLALVFQALQPAKNNAIRRRVDGIDGSDVTAAWFESLSHLKGQYMSNTVPGQYRYFSCSHPREDMQGMPILEWNDGERGKTITNVQSKVSEVVGRAARAASRVFPLTNNLFADAAAAIAGLPGVSSWLSTGLMTSEMQKLLGLRGKRGQRAVAEEKMDLVHAQRMVDITTAVNTIMQRILARDDYQEAVTAGQGFVYANPVLISGFRPGVEPTAAEAYHSAGVALDVQFSALTFSQASAKGAVVADAHMQAYTAARTEVLRAANEGLVAGIGFYSVIGDGLFAHMDRRDQASAAEIRQRNQGTREEYEAGELQPPPTSQTGKRAKFFRSIGKRDPVLGTGQERAAAPNPPLRGYWEQNTNESWSEFAQRVGLPFATKTARRLADQTVLGNEPGAADPLPGTGSQGVTSEVVVEGARPRISTRELNADIERYVVQFKPTVTKLEAALRAPEAELGVGKCRKGILIAQGPQRTPRVLTTDQIQTVSFVRHGSSKFAELVGTSQTSGQISFNALAVQRELTLLFQTSAQDVSDPTVMVQDVFADPYGQVEEDLASVELPVYENGTLVEQTTIEVPLFFDALKIEPSSLPASVRAQFEDLEVILADLTISQVALLPGYKPQGKQQDDGRAWQRPLNTLASDYANVITRQIENVFTRLLVAALEPSMGKPDRMAALQLAFGAALSKALGVTEAVTSVESNATQTKALKEGKTDKPVHSPVFPVSDEKGYEHYGAYRYGRGLSVDPGGTFEFLHSGQDPFQNVTAQTAEVFLQTFTLVKSGKINGDAALLQGAQDALARIAEFVLEERTDPFLPGPQETGEATVSSESADKLAVPVLGLEDREQREIEQSVLDLATTVTELGRTADGQQALRELLEANGDDPNLIYQDSFDITDTQFARNYANFAVTYGKSPVFKTTAANAAYQLADLTVHLDRTGRVCICRGSLADVLMAAYARERFVAIEGIDQTEQKAEAFESEQIVKAASQHAYQKQRVTGGVGEGPQPDASVNPLGTNAGR